MENLNDLYLFALVVDKGSFTAASKVAGLTTSRVSRRIAGLEERLGVLLLHRTTRKLSVTTIGEMYYAHCRAIVGEAEAAAEVVERIQSSPRGRVRITSPALSAQSVLGEIITDFMHVYPDVRISLTETDRFVDLVEEGIDVAIRFRATPMEDSSLVARSLGKSPSYLIASPGYLDQHGRPANPGELSQLQSLGKARNDGAYSWLLTNKNGDTQSVAFEPILESDDWLVLRQAVISGLGVVAMPVDFCREQIECGELEQVLPDWNLPSANLHIVFTSRRGLIPAVRAFIDFATERLAVTCSLATPAMGEDPTS